MQIELLTYIFDYKFQVACFLRLFSRKSKSFYNQFSDEILGLFLVFDVRLKPPLKFENTGVSAAAEEANMKDKLLSFSKLQKMSEFRDQFRLQLDFSICNFESDRHHITPEMRKPAVDILFSPQPFDSLLFSFN
jgi:hypothetical protein